MRARLAGVADGWERREAHGIRWVFRDSAREELKRALLSREGDAGAGIPVALPRRGRSFHELPSEGGGLFVKRLAPQRYDLSLLYRILAGRMRGEREFRNAVSASARGARVPEPLAFGVRHRPLRCYESLLVYRRLPNGAQPLAGVKLEGERREIRDRVGEEVARLAAEMHDRGVFHMDLTPYNVILIGDAAGAFSLVAVDLETIEIAAPDDLDRTRGALARMDATFRWPSAGERLRFLDAYLATRKALRADRRALAMDLWRARSATR